MGLIQLYIWMASYANLDFKVIWICKQQDVSIDDNNVMFSTYL